MEKAIVDERLDRIQEGVYTLLAEKTDYVSSEGFIMLSLLFEGLARGTAGERWPKDEDNAFVERMMTPGLFMLQCIDMVSFYEERIRPRFIEVVAEEMGDFLKDAQVNLFPEKKLERVFPLTIERLESDPEGFREDFKAFFEAANGLPKQEPDERDMAFKRRWEEYIAAIREKRKEGKSE